jgi:hypothetical protein
MRHITAPHMRGFVLELEKEAGLATLRNIGQRAAEFGKKHLAGRYGRQLALGAGLGAVGGAVTGDDENWKKRALQGAMLGSAAAGGRILATKAGRQAASEGAKRFGERQLYTLTGKGFKGRDIGLEDAKKLGIIKTPDFEKMTTTPGGEGLMGKVRRTAAKVTGKPAKSELAREANRYAAEVESFNKGFQNIPGVLHGALTQPGELLRSGWQRAGTAGKLFAGAGALEAGLAAAKKPEEGGPGRAQAALGSLGRSAGYLVAPGAMLGQSVVSGLAGKAGESVGKASDTAAQIAASRKAAQPSPQQLQAAYQQYTGNPLYYGGR